MRGVGLLLLALAGCAGGGGPGAGAQTTPEPLFADVTAASGIDFVGARGANFPQLNGLDQNLHQGIIGNGAAVGDYDGDGDLDIYFLGHAGHPNRLFRNNLEQGAKTFTDVTPALLADLGLGRVAHFVDLDNDGDLDLVVVNDDDGSANVGPSRLFRNEGGGAWSDATAGSGFRPVGYLHCGAAIADYDRDGRLDIYVTNWGNAGNQPAADFPGRNELYRNLGGFVFEEVTDAVNLGTLARDSFTAIFTDFDGDHFPDLHVAVDFTSDEFYFNQAGVFASATAAVGVTHTGNDMGVACADLDDDGDLDLYQTNITDPDANNVFQFNVLYLNLQSGSGQVEFFDDAFGRGAADTHWGWGVEFIDVEHDGDLDIVAVNGYDAWIEQFFGVASPLFDTPTTLLINDGTTNFTRLTGAGLDAPSDGRALIAFDYDRDGDLDLLATNVDQPARLYENRARNPGHWLCVALGPDRQAIGATVRATIGNVTKRRDVIAGRSYLSGTPSEVHFGLGDATVVDTLAVEWADGTVQVFNDVPADQLLRLVAP